MLLLNHSSHQPAIRMRRKNGRRLFEVRIYLKTVVEKAGNKSSDLKVFDESETELLWSLNQAVLYLHKKQVSVGKDHRIAAPGQMAEIDSKWYTPTNQPTSRKFFDVFHSKFRPPIRVRESAAIKF